MLLALLGAGTLLSANAEGQPQQAEADSHTRTAARNLAAQGAEAFENEEYLVALDLFQRAGALVEVPTIRLMEARTLVQLRRWVEAADKYAMAKNLSSAEPANEAFLEAAAAADAELEALRARIPLLNVKIKGGAPNSPVELWIDGRQIPAPLIGVDNPVDPGEHRVEVRHAKGDPIVQSVMLAERGREELLIELPSEEPPEPSPAADPQPVAPAQAPPPPTRSSANTLAWVALGTGAAATAAGAVTGLMALGKKSDLDEVCDPGCPESHEDDIHAFRTYRTISYVGFGLGVAGLAWGSYALWTSEPEDAFVAVRLLPGGARVEGSF